MSFFNKAREAFGQAAAAVSRETEVLSLQSQLGSVDTERERLLIEVGKRTQELHRAGKIKDAELDSLLSRVIELDEQMMQLRGKVQEAQSTAAAPPAPPPPAATAVAPPAPVPAPAAPAAVVPPAAGGKVCPRCSAAVGEERFCGECGAKIE